MYTIILTYLLKMWFDVNKIMKMQNLFHCIIEFIIVFFNAMSSFNLIMIFMKSKKKIIVTLNYFHLILNVSEQKNRLIHFIHLSFCDFLLNSVRCLNSTFSIDIKNAHDHLFSWCFQIMSSHLQQNMCHLNN